jgi:hypothetical protein
MDLSGRESGSCSYWGRRREAMNVRADALVSRPQLGEARQGACRRAYSDQSEPWMTSTKSPRWNPGT